MRKNKVTVIVAALFLLVLVCFNLNFTKAFFSVLLSYIVKPDIEYIKGSQWSYDEGYKVGMGDFLEFESVDSIFSIKRDSIFYKGRAKAIISRLNKYLNDLEVISIEKKESGFYTNTREFIN